MIILSGDDSLAAVATGEVAPWPSFPGETAIFGSILVLLSSVCYLKMQHDLSKLFDLSYCSVNVWFSIDLQKLAGLSNSRHIWGTKLESMILEDELRSNDDLITFHIILPRLRFELTITR